MRSVTTHAAFLAALLLLPLAAEAAPERLTVPGFRDAAFVAPAGPGKRPVALALHGNFDRPEWICEEFSVLVEGRGWLLCPRGIPRRDAPEEWDRWTYAGRKRLLAEIAAGLAALAGRFPGAEAPEAHLVEAVVVGEVKRLEPALRQDLHPERGIVRIRERSRLDAEADPRQGFLRRHRRDHDRLDRGRPLRRRSLRPTRHGSHPTGATCQEDDDRRPESRPDAGHCGRV